MANCKLVLACLALCVFVISFITITYAENNSNSNFIDNGDENRYSVLSENKIAHSRSHQYIDQKHHLHNNDDETTTTVNIKSLPNHVVESLKRRLLEIMDLKEVPKKRPPNEKIVIPEHYKEIYKSLMSNSDSSRSHYRTTRDVEQQLNGNGGSSNSNNNQIKKSNVRTTKDSEKCRIRTLKIDFNEVGWSDWIIAPNSYFADYCAGDCSWPLNDHLNVSNHAIIQSLYHSVGKVGVPRACCVPTKLSPISMLYTDEYGQVKLKNYKDMRVEGCGCQ